MTRAGQIAAIGLLVLGGIGIVGGIFALALAPIVFGGLLVLGALGYWQGVQFWTEHLAHQHAIRAQLELHARILQRLEGADANVRTAAHGSNERPRLPVDADASGGHRAGRG